MKASGRSTRVLVLISALLMTVGLLSAVSASDNEKDKKGVTNKGKETSEDIVEGTIKIPIELVLLDVGVFDKQHRAVADIGKSQFKIFEDKVPQKIEYFSSDTVPVSVALVIDTSGSMRTKLKAVIDAAKVLVRAARPGDEFCLVTFREKAQLIEEFTTDIDDIESALTEISAGSGTALLDAIYVSSDYAMKEAKNRRKALVVISDGDERDSVCKATQLMDRLREQDLQVYLIGFPGEVADANGFFYTSVREKSVKLINDIADESGGRAFFPKCLYDVCTLTEQISNDVHTQYTIGYFSSNEKRDGKWRKVQIKLEEEKGKKDVKDLAIRARKGYYAKQ